MNRIVEWKDCGEAAEVLLARPSRALRTVLVVLVALVASGLGWAHVTEVDLVVRAPGRVRPVT